MGDQSKNTAWGLWNVILDHFEALVGQKGSSLVVYPTLFMFGVLFPVIVACAQTGYWQMRSRGFDLLGPGLRHILGNRSGDNSQVESFQNERSEAEWSFFSKPRSFKDAIIGACSTKLNYYIGVGMWFLLGPIGVKRNTKKILE
jgi:hypothetical protein